MTPKRLNILGVPFDIITLEGTTEFLDKSCDSSRGKVFCVTPNPEICLLASNDPSYRHILKSAQLSIPDGFGILWAGRYLSGKKTFFRWLWTLLTPWQTRRSSPFPERVTGTDVMHSFCRRYLRTRIFLLGASPAVNDRLARKLIRDGVNIVGHFSGNDELSEEDGIRAMINASEAEMLFVAFGAPKQERWIDRNLPTLKTVRVAIGVGGAFDFLAGTKKRAPKALQQLGLEWFYRLIIEPKRIGRIFRATVIFPWRVLRSSHKP